MIKFPIKIEEMRKRACNETTIVFECEFINIEKKENEEMAKLTGYQSVAVVELGSGCCKKDYYFAIYEDGTKYAVGDTVYVSGNGSDRIVTIKDFVTPDFIEENIPNYLVRVRCTTEYTRWLFGHYHTNMAVNDKDICLFEQIVRVA